MRHVITCAGLLTALVACGSGTPSGGGGQREPIMIQGDGMGNAAGRFTISRPGATLSTATVTLNGGQLPTTADGFYQYQLTPFLVPGDELRLRVELDGDAVEGRAAIPAFPVVTMPTQNQVVTVGTDLDVAWTSAVDPSWWEVWIAANGVRVAGDSLPGTARTWSLPTTALSAGQQFVAVFVRPWVRGSFTGPADSRSNMRVQGGQVGRDLVIAGAGPAPIKILGADMGLTFQNFAISRGGADMSTAVVRINGTVIPTAATGFYSYPLPVSLTPGQELVIQVTHDGDTVEGRATILAPPVLTAPVTNQVVGNGTVLGFAWNAATDASTWQVRTSYQFNGGTSGGGQVGSVAGTARAANLTISSLPADATDLQAYVFGYLDGTFTGPIDPTSSMQVRIPSSGVSLVKGP